MAQNRNEVEKKKKDKGMHACILPRRFPYVFGEDLWLRDYAYMYASYGITLYSAVSGVGTRILYTDPTMATERGHQCV